MSREYSTRTLIELRQIGKTPSGTEPVFHHAPEAFKRIEVVATRRRHERPPQRLVPVCQRRREPVRPMDATAVGPHDPLCAGTAKEGPHLMDVCVFRAKVATDSMRNLPSIPCETCH
jgi:hypothetical protein